MILIKTIYGYRFRRLFSRANMVFTYWLWPPLLCFPAGLIDYYAKCINKRCCRFQSATSINAVISDFTHFQLFNVQQLFVWTKDIKFKKPTFRYYFIAQSSRSMWKGLIKLKKWTSYISSSVWVFPQLSITMHEHAQI